VLSHCRYNSHGFMGKEGYEKLSFPETTTQVLRETQRTELERHFFGAMKESTEKEGKKTYQR